MNAIVMVDAFSSGSRLAMRFSARGFHVYHLVSSESVPEFFLKTKPIGVFQDEIMYHDDPTEIVAWLSKIHPDCIVPGTETGVPLADTLSAILRLPGNSEAKSSARRNKYEMIQTLHDNGVAAAEHFRSEDLSEILDWVADHGGFPKVIKPLQSAGSDGVTVCKSRDGCIKAFQDIHKSINRLGLQNKEVLVEEYLQGTEFMINAVRCKGETIITDFGLSKRIVTSTGTLIYDGIETLPFDHPSYPALSAYFKQCLDALEIDYGAAHGEVMLTERGPVLIEVGARLPGGGVPSMIESCSTYSPFDAVIDSYCFPEQFHRYAVEGVHHEYTCEMVFLISGVEGRLSRPLTAEDFSELPSFMQFFWDLPKSGEIRITKDLFDCPGHIFLRHKDPLRIAGDHEAVRMIEKRLFEELVETSGDTIHA